MKYTKLILLIFVCFVWLNVPSVFAQTDYVMAYPFTDFKGTQFVLKEDWKGSNLWDRKIKSIRVPPGYRVRMYEDRNFKGAETMITED